MNIINLTSKNLILNHSNPFQDGYQQFTLVFRILQPFIDWNIGLMVFDA